MTKQERKGQCQGTQSLLSISTKEDFPGGPTVKNMPAYAGVTGWIPGPGRFHMPRSICHNYRAHTLEPARAGDERSHRNEKPVHHN